MTRWHRRLSSRVTACHLCDSQLLWSPAMLSKLFVDRVRARGVFHPACGGRGIVSSPTGSRTHTVGYSSYFHADWSAELTQPSRVAPLGGSKWRESAPRRPLERFRLRFKEEDESALVFKGHTILQPLLPKAIWSNATVPSLWHFSLESSTKLFELFIAGARLLRDFRGRGELAQYLHFRVAGAHGPDHPAPENRCCCGATPPL